MEQYKQIKEFNLEGSEELEEEFLKEIREEERTIKIDTDNYVITGVPFYNYTNENDFNKALEETLNVAPKK